jgi:hypothetical protein
MHVYRISIINSSVLTLNLVSTYTRVAGWLNNTHDQRILSDLKFSTKCRLHVINVVRFPVELN